MNLGLTVLAHRRPAYFAQMAASLAAIAHDDWDVVITLDRPDAATLAIAEGMDAMLHVFTHEPAARIGDPYDRDYRRISVLTRSAIRAAFERGADFVMHFEEDLVLAPDCLAYAGWAAQRYRADPSVFTVNAWGMAETLPGLYATRTYPFFTPWGWGTWRDRWAEMDRLWDVRRWDQHLNERIRGDRLGVFPDVARTRNVGVAGTQSADEWFVRENSAGLHFADTADPAHWQGGKVVGT